MPLETQQAQEWRRPGEAAPTRQQEQMNDWRRMVILAVRQDQIIAADWLENGESCDSDRYIRFLNETLRPYIENPDNFSPGEIPVILQDNARPHTARATEIFITSMGWA